MTSQGTLPRINAIATAVPDGEIDAQYRQWATAKIADPRMRKLFKRMSARSGIDARYTVLDPSHTHFSQGSFYGQADFPSTGARMQVYADCAPDLALRAISGLPELGGITHIVIASCTGFLAPGLDQIIARRLKLGSGVERISIGFMGCYAGITALRTAAHLVKSDPAARVLVVSVELCTLHLQETEDLESLLAMGQFADGAAAAIISGEGAGLTMGRNISAELEESNELIRWHIGDSGFVMHLSGAVPGRIADALEDGALTDLLNGDAAVDSWAVHPGGKSILDSVERGLCLSKTALDKSRGVLARFGNMSSATIMFVLAEIMGERPVSGMAMAFGPGLALEGFRYGWADAG